MAVSTLKHLICLDVSSRSARHTISKEASVVRDISVDEVISAIQMPCRVIGSTARAVNMPCPLETARARSIAFCAVPPDFAAGRINASEASVIIAPIGLNLDSLETAMKTCILCRRPRLAFIRVMRQFFVDSFPPGVHPTAVIHESARLGNNVHVGSFTYIGRASIGDDTVIDGHVHIYDDVWVGRGCTIQAGAVIGSRGFGMERNESGEFEDFPHIGGVTIKDNVVIGVGVTIAKGTLENTVIGPGTRIDALCEISHNARIGANCGLCASCVVSGSSILSDGSWIAAGTLIREGLRIGSQAMVGLGSVVVKDVRKSGLVYGVPARDRGQRGLL